MDPDTFKMRWAGTGSFEVRFPDVAFAIDPNYVGTGALDRAQPEFDYIFCSHEHFDHCNPPSLAKLCRGPRFKRLFVSPGCLRPDLSLGQKYGDVQMLETCHLPITKHVPAGVVQTVEPQILSVSLRPAAAPPPQMEEEPQLSDEGRRTKEAAGVLTYKLSHFGARAEAQVLGSPALELEGLTVHTFESGESTGYLVTHVASGVTIMHTGDMHEPYVELAAFAGKVDFLIHTPSASGIDIAGRLHNLVDWVRPRNLIPIHYRTDRKSDPVLGGESPPNVSDENAYMEWIREELSAPSRGG
jgi:L-ascorbate metabolism protein UlaG (beta-lactamase superfamily)